MHNIAPPDSSMCVVVRTFTILYRASTQESFLRQGTFFCSSKPSKTSLTSTFRTVFPPLMTLAVKNKECACWFACVSGEEGIVTQQKSIEVIHSETKMKEGNGLGGTCLTIQRRSLFCLVTKPSVMVTGAVQRYRVRNSSRNLDSVTASCKTDPRESKSKTHPKQTCEDDRKRLFRKHTLCDPGSLTKEKREELLGIYIGEEFLENQAAPRPPPRRST